MHQRQPTSALSGLPEVEPSAEIMKAKLEAFLERHFKDAIERGPDGTQRIGELFEIMCDRPMRYNERLALRAGLREGTIDTQKMLLALRRGSPAGVGDVLDQSAEQNAVIFGKRAQDWALERNRAISAQQHVVGIVNLSEAHLPAHDRSRVEAALGDGRANPRTVATMIANSQTEEVIELAQELEEERQLQHHRARSLTRGAS